MFRSATRVAMNSGHEGPCQAPGATSGRPVNMHQSTPQAHSAKGRVALPHVLDKNQSRRSRVTQRGPGSALPAVCSAALQPPACVARAAQLASGRWLQCSHAQPIRHACRPSAWPALCTPRPGTTVHRPVAGHPRRPDAAGRRHQQRQDNPAAPAGRRAARQRPHHAGRPVHRRWRSGLASRGVLDRPARRCRDALTPVEVMAAQRALHPGLMAAAWQRHLQGFDLAPHLGKAMYQLSTGSRRKVALALALSARRHADVAGRAHRRAGQAGHRLAGAGAGRGRRAARPGLADRQRLGAGRPAAAGGHRDALTEDRGCRGRAQGCGSSRRTRRPSRQRSSRPADRAGRGRFSYSIRRPGFCFVASAASTKAASMTKATPQRLSRNSVDTAHPIEASRGHERRSLFASMSISAANRINLSTCACKRSHNGAPWHPGSLAACRNGPVVANVQVSASPSCRSPPAGTPSRHPLHRWWREAGDPLCHDAPR